jgi:uncharacterized protein (TIGR02466 family)
MEFKVFERLWWATPVWECPVSDIDNKSIAEYCSKLKNETEGVTISNRGGWHSDELKSPIPSDLERLFNDLTVFVNDVSSRYTGTNELILGNWWVNINGKHDYNMPHDHQNSILSGVYYVSVPDKDMGDLILHRGDSAEFFLTSKVSREQTMSNALSVRCLVDESKFYLFPSWVKHSVERNNSDSERISIAFNFVTK